MEVVFDSWFFKIFDDNAKFFIFRMMFTVLSLFRQTKVLFTRFDGFTAKNVENVKFGCFDGKFKENYKQSSFYETVSTVNEEIIIEWSSNN